MQAEGAIEGDASLYEVPSPYATQYVFSRFDGAERSGPLPAGGRLEALVGEEQARSAAASEASRLLSVAERKAERLLSEARQEARRIGEAARAARASWEVLAARRGSMTTDEDDTRSPRGFVARCSLG